ncbi:DUF47 domain-containing protein [Longimicrobium sp.]|uniref:DUF47 domain-containing protein n=1 Tax=Longimicrobium sp. TaxID=2029185 RepID=UPI002E2FB402|nr:DUF47 family protein [Longimicrobium sp.]HEX6037747.1 DUF47 family protein [Longimicrobium sp.]
MTRLLPADEAYFQMLDELAGLLTEAAVQLAHLMAQPAHSGPLVQTIRHIEHRADELAHEIDVRLSTTFVTPFEPEDIHGLAGRIDRVVDLAEDAAETVETLRLEQPDEQARRLADVLLRACQLLASSVSELKKPKRVLEHTRRMKRLEAERGTAFDAALRELFPGTPDPLDVLRRKTLYDGLKAAIDECGRVAGVLERIAVKHI